MAVAVELEGFNSRRLAEEKLGQSSVCKDGRLEPCCFYGKLFGFAFYIRRIPAQYNNAHA